MTQTTIQQRETEHINQITKLNTQINNAEKELSRLKEKKEFHWRAIRNLVSKKKLKGEY